MILEQLTLTNFRVFKDRNTFDLSPRIQYGKKRPIILFGGLNGAGKTTILTAIRQVLYGKQILGSGASNKAYEVFLETSIHRPKCVTFKSSSSSIELTFSYASMGVKKNYLVKRSWMLENKKIVERLSIFEDGIELTALNKEQCQGFLNELIPIGVSDLFFFDGEKIAELAEDAAGKALGDSIKKLLGLDLLETLDSDLTLLQRQKSKKNASKEIQQRITKLEKQLEKIEAQARKEQEAYQQAKPIEVEAQSKIDKLESLLSEKGGAWAATRESETRRAVELEVEKNLLEAQIRDLISDKFPIAIAREFAQSALSQLMKEKEQKSVINTSDLVRSHLTSLELKLEKLLSSSNFKQTNNLIKAEFEDVLDTQSDIQLIHDVSDSVLTSIESVIKDATGQQQHKIQRLHEKLLEKNLALDNIGKNIARAPESAQIQPVLDDIRIEQKRKQDSIRLQARYLEKYKRFLRDAIDITRQLDKLSEELATESNKDRTLNLISDAKDLLKDFKKEIANKKVKDLEKELIMSFERLSRKDDHELHVEIDPRTFSVKLTGENGRAVDKNDLSAGEKQIYAISILEALAKTSGRNLPIIIDTPLGRLDSVHRKNLINNYLPHASHQVIVLSTDTEVGEAFHADLSSEISHAYKLDYSSKTGSTTADEGYFWETAKQEVS